MFPACFSRASAAHALVDIQLSLFESPKPHGFVLRIADDKHFLAADDEAERDKWIDAFVEHWGAAVDKASVNISTKHSYSQQLESLVPMDSLAGPMIEMISQVQFPGALRATGDVLLGVGPFVRRVRWTDEPILAVALYIDPIEAMQALDAFKNQSLESLDQSFYDALMHASVRKTFVFACRKRLSKSRIVAALNDELGPRMGAAVNELEQLTSFVEKSLRKGECMIVTVLATGLVDFHFKGTSHPCLSAPALARSLQGLFFDSNSIQSVAKRSLVSRFPYLWGKPKTRLPQLPEEDDEDDEDDDEDDEEEDEEMDEEDEQWVHSNEPLEKLFAQMIDLESQAVFPGALSDGSVLLGTWSSAQGPFAVKTEYSVGLYVDPIRASEHLVKFKGLSLGSIAADTDFAVIFTTGAFLKRIALVLSQSMPTAALCDILSTILSSAHLVGDQVLGLKELFTAVPKVLSEGDMLYLTICADGCLTISTQVTEASSATAVPKSQQVALGKAMQSLFHGYTTKDVHARARLMQRLPYLLDHANADLVHTYHDEIAMLRENYKRLPPASRLKVGYLMLYNPTRKASLRWSRQWCRLDGVVFSIYAQKNNLKPRESFLISHADIQDLSDEMLHDLRKLDDIALAFHISRPNGESLVLRADSADEGNEWFDALSEASHVASPASPVPLSMPPLTLPPSLDHLPEDSDDANEEEDEDFEQDELTDREQVGSLITWAMDDSRNQLILLLLAMVLWLISDLNRV